MAKKNIAYFCNDPGLDILPQIKLNKTKSSEIHIKHLSNFEDLSTQEEEQDLSIFNGHGRHIKKTAEKPGYLRATISEKKHIRAIDVLKALVEKTKKGGTIVWLSCDSAFLLNDIGKAKELQKRIAKKKLTIIILGGRSVGYSHSKSEINTFQKLILAEKDADSKAIVNEKWADRYQYFDPKERIWKKVEAVQLAFENDQAIWFRDNFFFSKKNQWAKEEPEDVTEKMEDLSTGYANSMLETIKKESFNLNKTKEHLRKLKLIFDRDNRHELPKSDAFCLLGLSLRYNPQWDNLFFFQAIMEVYGVEVIKKSFTNRNSCRYILRSILNYIDRNPKDKDKLRRILNDKFGADWITIINKSDQKYHVCHLIENKKIPAKGFHTLFHLGFFNNFNKKDISDIKLLTQITEKDNDIVQTNKKNLEKIITCHENFIECRNFFTESVRLIVNNPSSKRLKLPEKKKIWAKSIRKQCIHHFIKEEKFPLKGIKVLLNLAFFNDFDQNDISETIKSLNNIRAKNNSNAQRKKKELEGLLEYFLKCHSKFVECYNFFLRHIVSIQNESQYEKLKPLNKKLMHDKSVRERCIHSFIKEEEFSQKGIEILFKLGFFSDFNQNDIREALESLNKIPTKDGSKVQANIAYLKSKLNDIIEAIESPNNITTENSYKTQANTASSKSDPEESKKTKHEQKPRKRNKRIGGKGATSMKARKKNMGRRGKKRRKGM